MFKAYSRSQWDQGNVCSIRFPAPPDSHATILSATPDISQKRCDLYPWNVRKHGKSEVSSQTYLQRKADLQRRKGFRTKSRKATRMIVVEMHYYGAPRFLDCSLKNPCRSSLLCMGEVMCLKVSSKPVSKPMIHRNSARAKQAASWGSQEGECHTRCHGHQASDSWLQEVCPGTHCPQARKLLWR